MNSCKRYLLEEGVRQVAEISDHQTLYGDSSHLNAHSPNCSYFHKHLHADGMSMQNFIYESTKEMKYV